MKIKNELEELIISFTIFLICAPLYIIYLEDDIYKQILVVAIGCTITLSDINNYFNYSKVIDNLGRIIFLILLVIFIFYHFE